MLTTSDHFSSQEVAHKSLACKHGDDAMCAPCIARGACVMFVISRPRRRAPIDRFQLMFPGFEFALDTWPADERQVQEFVEHFDAHYPWQHKVAAAVWRGSPNGPNFKAATWNRTAQEGNVRARLVWYGAQHTKYIDAAFTFIPKEEVCCEEKNLVSARVT